MIANFLSLVKSQSWLAGNIVARALFGLSISVAAVSRLAPADAAKAFQLMMLQAIIGILMAGRGFVRGATAQERGQVYPALLASFMLVCTVVVVLVAFDLIAPMTVRQIAPFDNSTTWIILLLGAGAGALTLITQGVLAASGEAKLAYAPAVIANLICMMAIPIAADSLHSVLVLWSTAQLLSLTATLPYILRHTQNAKTYVNEGGASLIFREAFDASSIGLINACNMLIIYFFREQWRTAASPDIVEIIFFLLRISDVAFQMTFYLFSLGKFGSLFGRLKIRRSHLRWTVIAYLASMSAFSVACLCLGAMEHDELIALIAIILVAQLTMDFVRFLSSWVTIDVLREMSSGKYFIVGTLPYVAASLLAWWLLGFEKSATLYVFLAASSSFQTGLGLYYFSRRPRPLRHSEQE